MAKLAFYASEYFPAKQIVDFWNPYCEHLNHYEGNGHCYVIDYDSHYKITGYRCETPASDFKRFNSAPDFMTFPKAVRDKMIERSISKSPVAFILNITACDGSGCFTWNDTPEGQDFWSSVIEDQDFDLFYNHFNLKEHESRLFEQESPLRRGSSNITSGVCCRKHKARVTIISPGYQEVIGRG